MALAPCMDRKERPCGPPARKAQLRHKADRDAGQAAQGRRAVDLRADRFRLRIRRADRFPDFAGGVSASSDRLTEPKDIAGPDQKRPQLGGRAGAVTHRIPGGRHPVTSHQVKCVTLVPDAIREASIEPRHDPCRQTATGGLQCPDLIQRRQALFGLAALCVLERPDSRLLSHRSHRQVRREPAWPPERSISVEGRWKLALAEDDGWLIVIVTHLGISGG